MRRKRSKRYLKKYLRRREAALGRHLPLFLGGFNSEKPLDDEGNFRLLLKLRWLVYDFIYVRLKLHPQWMKKRWFLELLDIDSVKLGNSGVEFNGDMVWWAEGKDAVGEWWPADHEPHRIGVYKAKIRGDLDGGRWVIEPVIAKLRMPKLPKRNAVYEIDFGEASTYLKVKSR